MEPTGHGDDGEAKREANVTLIMMMVNDDD